MRWIHRHGREQRVKLTFTVIVCEGQSLCVEFIDLQYANLLLGQGRPQTLVPTGILFVDKFVGGMVDKLALLRHGQTVESAGVIAVFELLEQAPDTDFKELIEVAGGDRQKLHPLEERIGQVTGFLKNTPVELQPRFLAVEKKGTIVRRFPNHRIKGVPCVLRE